MSFKDGKDDASDHPANLQSEPPQNTLTIKIYGMVCTTSEEAMREVLEYTKPLVVAENMSSAES